MRTDDPGRAPSGLLDPGLLTVLAASLLVYWVHGLQAKLTHDNALYYYSAQEFVRGVPPYVGIFDIKTPLTTFFTAIGVWLAKALSLDELTTVRAIYVPVALGTNVLLYRLGVRLFRIRWVGVLAVLGLLALHGLTFQTLAGPQPKILFLLFMLWALLAVMDGRWLAAGVASALALLTWQPAAVVGLIAGVAALAHVDRGRALLRLGIGALAPLLLAAGYFVAVGAFQEFLEGALLIHLKFYGHGTSAVDHFEAASRTVSKYYTVMQVPILLGVIYLAARLGRAWARPSSSGGIARNDALPVLLVLLLFVAWSIFDFQGYPDWFPLLPFAMLGFGGLLGEAVGWIDGRRPRVALVVAGAMAAVLLGLGLRVAVNGSRDRRYQNLVAAVRKIGEEYGPEASVVSFSPQFLAVSGRRNPTRHVVINSGIDRYIDETTEGGIEGWVAELAAEVPDVIVAGRSRGELLEPLQRWMRSGRRRVKVGRLILWVKVDRGQSPM